MSLPRDEAEFEALFERHRRELQVHCYGSALAVLVAGSLVMGLGAGAIGTVATDLIVGTAPPERAGARRARESARARPARRRPRSRPPATPSSRAFSCRR